MAVTNIKSLKKEIKQYYTLIKQYEKAFLAEDGVISQEEQQVLDKIYQMILSITETIKQREGKEDLKTDEKTTLTIDKTLSPQERKKATLAFINSEFEKIDTVLNSFKQLPFLKQLFA